MIEPIEYGRPWWEVMKELKADNDRLKAEVERLRKAGDTMAEALNLNDDVFDNQEKREAQSNWNAAKEGKPNA